MDGKIKFRLTKGRDLAGLETLITNVAMEFVMSFPLELQSLMYRAVQSNANFARIHCSQLPISTVAQICSNI